MQEYFLISIYCTDIWGCHYLWSIMASSFYKSICKTLYCLSCFNIVPYFLQGKKIEATPLSMYNFFIERVRSNLHICLAMSPIGDAFRNRLRQFPSLINCCTIDWFQVAF